MAALAHALEQRAAQAERRGGMTNQPRRLFLRLRLRVELEPVLGGQVVELVRRPARLDQVRRDHRVFDRAGVSSSACSRTSSSDPYCAISCPAVLSPIPGIPGMLSDGSPFSPMKSGTWSGRIPRRASTRSGV